LIVLADALISLRNLIWIVNIAAAVFLLGVAYAAIRERRRRRVTPMNKLKYHPDEVMEGPRLERMGAWALGAMAVIAVALPAYWLLEPGRQDSMDDQFLETSITQGEELFAPSGSNEFALGCADCHGPEGQGGATVQSVEISREDLDLAGGALDAADRICAPIEDDDTSLLCQVTWQAPALDTVYLRHSREEIERIITYGRPGTPMPAWGLEGGGSKNEQSIENLADFIESIQISPEEAKAQEADLTDGRELFEAHCARCHTKHWSYAETFAGDANFDLLVVPAGGAFGPNLTNGVTLRQFPDIEDHIQFVIDGSDFEAPYGVRGIGSGRMPGFGGMLTEDQIRAIVEYERSLGEGEATSIRQLLGGREAGGDGGDGGEEDAPPAEQGAGEGGEQAGGGQAQEENEQ